MEHWLRWLCWLTAIWEAWRQDMAVASFRALWLSPDTTVRNRYRITNTASSLIEIRTTYAHVWKAHQIYCTSSIGYCNISEVSVSHGTWIKATSWHIGLSLSISYLRLFLLVLCFLDSFMPLPYNYSLLRYMSVFTLFRFLYTFISFCTKVFTVWCMFLVIYVANLLIITKLTLQLPRYN
jgi:hypothetical protein